MDFLAVKKGHSAELYIYLIYLAIASFSER